jgi:hypothetical protein
MTDGKDEPDRTPTPPFKRRSLLASAALAAAAPVSASEPAKATGQPTNSRPTTPGHGSVARLLAVPQHHRGTNWLKTALQIAVELELATIPPYLCGWWSIKDRTCEAARLIRRIVGDEMYHLGLVCNLLVAVGGRPHIKKAAPTYPGPLPGGVRTGVNVYLSGLTKPFVHDVMMAIEAPETPLTRNGNTSPSVGAFYTDLLKTFHTTAPKLSTRGQLSAHIGSDVLKPIATLNDVEHSIEIIKEQGEGTDGSPDDAFDHNHPAHYYAFAEIYHGQQLRNTRGSWQFTGTPVPFPAARPMATVPTGGWHHPPKPVHQLLTQFDTTYTTVLDTLDMAWTHGTPHTLDTAIRAMHRLQTPAVELMETPIPHTHHTYGPQFRTT